MKCLECHRPGATRAVLGGYTHPACVPAPAGRLVRTAEPPPELDRRRMRAERVAPYRPGVTALDEFRARAGIEWALAGREWA